MGKFFKWIGILILVGLAIYGGLALLGAKRATAAEINCASPTGSYCTTFAPLIKEVQRQARFNYDIADSKGSVEACQRVVDDPTDVSIVQLDVAMQCIAANPGKVLLVRTLADECVFGVTMDSSISTWGRVEDLGSRIRIGTGPIGSGADATLRAIMGIDPESRLARRGIGNIINYENVDAALAALASGEDKDGDSFPDVDVVVFVAYADPESATFAATAKAKMTFMSVAHPAMRDLKFGEQNIYTLKEMAVGKAGMWGLGSAPTIQTACTSAVIVTGDPAQFTDELDQEDQAELVSILTDAPADAFVPKTDKWTAIFANVKEVVGKAADDVWENINN